MILQLILIVLTFATILIIPVATTGSGLQAIQSRLHKNSLVGMIVSFWLSLFLWIFFDRSCADYQFIFHINFWQNFFPCDLPYGVDGISLFFILLTTFISPLCLLTSWKKKFIQVKEFCLYFLLLEIFLILAFTALDLMSFFIFFESILIPMFFIIGIWGFFCFLFYLLFFFLYTLW
jgi:NADH:ubiquinone oxidoreductase subunit 4 (subunit M)